MINFIDVIFIKFYLRDWTFYGKVKYYILLVGCFEDLAIFQPYRNFKVGIINL